MFNAVTSVFDFLIAAVFNLFIFILILRAVMQASGVHYFNPLAQIALRLTNWLVMPLRKIFPLIKNVDLAIIVAILLVEFIKFSILTWPIIAAGQISTIFIYCIFDAVSTLLNLYFFAILFRALISWIMPLLLYNPITEVLMRMTDPILIPIKRLIPPISGIDFSPLIAMILIKALDIFLHSLMGSFI